MATSCQIQQRLMPLILTVCHSVSWSIVSQEQSLGLGPRTPHSSCFLPVSLPWSSQGLFFLLLLLFLLSFYTKLPRTLCLSFSMYPYLQFCHVTLNTTYILMTTKSTSLTLRAPLISQTICPTVYMMVPLDSLIRV